MLCFKYISLDHTVTTVSCSFDGGDRCGYRDETTNSQDKWEMVPKRFLSGDDGYTGMVSIITYVQKNYVRLLPKGIHVKSILIKDFLIWLRKGLRLWSVS